MYKIYVGKKCISYIHYSDKNKFQFFAFGHWRYFFSRAKLREHVQLWPMANL